MPQLYFIHPSPDGAMEATCSLNETYIYFLPRDQAPGLTHTQGPVSGGDSEALI